MNEWIQRANLNVFRQLIAAEEDEARRHELEQILDEQEARLNAAIADRFAAPDETRAKVKA